MPWCVSIEHKLGIHASPTAVMAFGDHAARSVIWLARESRPRIHVRDDENVARFGVGMEGVSVSERAYQRARDYANQRIRGPTSACAAVRACRSSRIRTCGGC